MLNLNSNKINRFKKLLDSYSYDLITQTLADRPYINLDSYLSEKKGEILIKLFYFQKKFLIRELECNFGQKYIDELLQLGVLIRNNNYISSLLKIHSLFNLYFASSYVDYRALDYAYFGKDSLLLSHYLPYNFKSSSTLDLCTGTGVQAILMANNSTSIIGTDISPIAQNIAQFNVLLNNVEDRVKIINGNIYEPIGKKKFDLIISNPPYISIPNSFEYPICGNGGEDGLLILKKIISDLDLHLNQSGVSLILGNTIGNDKEPFIVDYLKSNLMKFGWDIEIVVIEKHPKEEEMFNRTLLLTNHNIVSSKNAQAEFQNMYERLNVTNTYIYLLRIKKGKGSIKKTNIFENSINEKISKVTDVTSFKTIEFLMINSFNNGHYKRVVELYKVIDKFHTTFNIPYTKELLYIINQSQGKQSIKKT